MGANAAHRILCVASECFPLIKTGGLADVVGALPLALKALGHDVRVFLPAFPAVKKAALSKRKLCDIPELFGGPAKIISAKSATGIRLFLLDAPHLFNMPGNPYQDGNGKDRADNHLRFGAFSYAAAALSAGDYGRWRADIVHAHDWQAGLVPAYLALRSGARPKSILTIHNLAFQGLFPKSEMKTLRLPSALFSRDGLEYWDQISFLKAGIVYSDWVTTVSPGYAAEIRSDEGGMGFGGLLQNLHWRLSGIVNGIDTDVWNPETDADIAATYSAAKYTGKALNKRAAQAMFGLAPDASAPLFCVISRLTEQKGLDLLVRALPHIVGNGGQVAILGSGDDYLERAFQEAAAAHPGQVGTFIGYNETASHQLQAGADAILIPSRFEPCGLTQLCAMRYGTLPVAARVGGLGDTIIDANEAAMRLDQGTGFLFSPTSEAALRAAIDRVLALYSQKQKWRKIRSNAMRQDVSWAGPAQSYSDLYTLLLATR